MCVHDMFDDPCEKQQERPRAPVVKLSYLQEHVHKKTVLEIVSHHSKYNIFKARNSCTLLDKSL